MVYGGALAGGAFTGQTVTLLGEPIESTLWAYIAVVTAGVVGYVLGSILGWAIGLYGGRPYLERHGRWLHVTPEKLDDAERWFEHYGNVTVLVSRCLPVVRSFISIPAGIAEMPLGRYTVLTTAGSIPWYAGLAAIGVAVGANWERFHEAFRYADIRDRRADRARRGRALLASPPAATDEALVEGALRRPRIVLRFRARWTRSIRAASSGMRRSPGRRRAAARVPSLRRPSIPSRPMRLAFRGPRAMTGTSPTRAWRATGAGLGSTRSPESSPSLTLALAVVLSRGGEPALERPVDEVSLPAAPPASPPPAALVSAVETADMRMGDDGRDRSGAPVRARRRGLRRGRRRRRLRGEDARRGRGVSAERRADGRRGRRARDRGRARRSARATRGAGRGGGALRPHRGGRLGGALAGGRVALPRGARRRRHDVRGPDAGPRREPRDGARRRRRPRRRLQQAAGARALLDARDERRLLRRPRPAREVDRHQRRGRRRLPVLPVARLPVPPDRELRGAQQAGRAGEDGRGAPARYRPSPSAASRPGRAWSGSTTSRSAARPAGNPASPRRSPPIRFRGPGSWPATTRSAMPPGGPSSPSLRGSRAPSAAECGSRSTASATSRS